MSEVAPKMKSNQPMKVHLASLGCAKNLVDSERLLGRLSIAGALVGAPIDDADAVIVNTCGFIRSAIDESLDVIAEYLEMKRDRPHLRVLVMGCLVERAADDLRKQLPEVDGFYRLDQHAEIAQALGLLRDEEGGRLLLTPDHMAYLRISDGCDNRCTYCTIPLIRGPFRSRPSDEILREACQLAEHGAIELNLIGQDTSLYGTDLGTGEHIGNLLRRLNDVPGLQWLRLLYTHPAHFGDELIDAYGELPRLVPYVDLPLQHMDDDILSRMGRRVTAEACQTLIAKLRRRLPDVVLRTTFIVGFPGETEAQFAGLLSTLEEIRFDHVGAFAFSPEVGTPAAGMPDQVPEEVRSERVERLMLAQQRIALEANERLIGNRAQVLIDYETEDPGIWVGRTAGQAPDVDSVTFVSGSELTPGMIVDAEITGSQEYDLIANAF